MGGGDRRALAAIGLAFGRRSGRRSEPVAPFPVAGVAFGHPSKRGATLHASPGAAAQSGR
eukprot:2077622-Alexandrium_andersonii.AAC.1